ILAGIAITIGLILIIVPGLFLITIWAVIVPVIVLEGAGVFDAFRRSHQLVRGRGWHVFGTLVVTWIILLVVNLVLGAIFVPRPLPPGAPVGPGENGDRYARTAAAQCFSRCGTRSSGRSSGKNSRAPSTVIRPVVPGMVSRSQRAQETSKNSSPVPHTSKVGT